MRGEFIRGDGLILPNNVTAVGAEMILRLALQDLAFIPCIGLCEGVFTPDMTLSSLVEPTIGTGGYARQAMNRNTTDWPTIGHVNGETFIESRPYVFAPSGGGFNQDIARPFISDGLTSQVILMLGSPLPDPIRLLSSTPIQQRTFSYRLYLR